MKIKTYKIIIKLMVLCLLLLFNNGCAERNISNTKDESRDDSLIDEESPYIDSNNRVELGIKKDEGIYTYISDIDIISPEQAVDIVASIVKEESEIQLVLMQDANNYYYQLNPRIFKNENVVYLSIEEYNQYLENGTGNIGDQLIINKIECRDSKSEASLNGYYEVIIYEDIIDNIKTKEGHQAITSEYAVDFVKKIVVEDYIWNDWYSAILEDRNILNN